MEVRATQVRAVKIRIAQVRVPEQGSGQPGVAQICAA